VQMLCVRTLTEPGVIVSSPSVSTFEDERNPERDLLALADCMVVVSSLCLASAG